MLRRTLVAAGAAIAVSVSLAAGAAAGVRPLSGTTPTADVSALPFNTQAQQAADNITSEDESLTLQAAGLPNPATVAKPLATNPDASLVGITITGSELQITVSGTASAALTKAISDQAAGIPVSIRVVNHSAAQLAAVQKKIDADSKYWALQGIILTAWGPDLASNKVSVSLANYSSSAAKAIIARYGNEWVSVNPVSMTLTPAASPRTTDKPPWTGADEIRHLDSNNVSRACTSGFGMNINGVSYVPTDAHCLNSNYKSSFYSPNSIIFGTSYIWNNAIDSVIIQVASAKPNIWADPTATSRVVVKVAAVDPVGGLNCTDGITTLEICNVVIDKVGQEIRYAINGSQTNVYGTVLVCQKNGIASILDGDSGGPVEVSLGSTQATAVGAILAGVNGQPACGYYMPERTIEQNWGAAVTLGS